MGEMRLLLVAFVIVAAVAVATAALKVQKSCVTKSSHGNLFAPANSGTDSSCDWSVVPR